MLHALRYDHSAWDLDPKALRSTFRVSPEYLVRHRPSTPPRWEPGRDRRDAGARRQYMKISDWGNATLLSAPDAGAVRIGMTWRRRIATSAAFSKKAGRTMFFESQYEIASFRLREIMHTSIDNQYQPIGFHWKRTDGSIRAYFPDSLELTETGELVFREYKASQAYYDDPEIAEKLAAADAALARYPHVRLERVVGSTLMKRTPWRVAKNIFDDRMIDYDERQADAARDVVARTGGLAALGEVREAISPNRNEGRRIANAMLVSRVIGFRVDQPPTADTQVILPRPPAQPERLREFLASFSQERS